jgi:hypothetical protein
MSIEGGKSDPKKEERYKLRTKIGEIIFFIEQVTNEHVVLSDIRQGEAQSKEFIVEAKNILENQNLWNKVPEQGEAGSTLHGVFYKRKYTREGLHKELSDMIEKHEQLVS